MEPLQFHVSLDEKDWDNFRAAWRCPALRVPGAKLHAFYSQGNQGNPEHPDSVPVQGEHILWKPRKKPPAEAMAVITVPADAESAKKAEINLKRSQVRWKGMTALAAVVGPIVGGLLARCDPPPPPPPPPPVPIADAGVSIADCGVPKAEEACEVDDADCWRKRVQDASWIMGCVNEHLIGATQVQGATERCRQLGIDHHACAERQGALERAKAIDCYKLPIGHIGY